MTVAEVVVPLDVLVVSSTGSLGDRGSLGSGLWRFIKCLPHVYNG